MEHIEPAGQPSRLHQVNVLLADFGQASRLRYSFRMKTQVG